MSHLSYVLGAIEGAMSIAVICHLCPVGLPNNEANVPHSQLLLPFLNVSPSYLNTLTSDIIFISHEHIHR